MLLDTKRVNKVGKTSKGLDYTPSDFEHDNKVLVFRITWDGEDQGDLVDFADALKFVQEFPGEAEAEEDVRQWLNSGRAFRVGPDEDWYRITPLSEPMKLNYDGELVPESEPFFPEIEERPTGPTGYGFPFSRH